LKTVFQIAGVPEPAESEIIAPMAGEEGRERDGQPLRNVERRKENHLHPIERCCEWRDDLNLRHGPVHAAISLFPLAKFKQL
jgi:hypothetical protein